MRSLCLVVKHWAKRHDLNCPFEHTLSSYAWSLLVLHFLQTCEPAVLPCLCPHTTALVRPLPKQKNSQSVAELLLGFFKRYTLEDESPTVSVRLGTSTTTRLACAQLIDPGVMSIEDPISPDEDLGRTRSAATHTVIQRMMSAAHDCLLLSRSSEQTRRDLAFQAAAVVFGFESTDATQIQNRRASRRLCSYHQRGMCNKGPECRFSHE